MDCLLAQQIVSAAADSEPVDAALLAAARAHCETCPDCSRFVRAQIAALKTDLPEPPADLADRVIAVVRAEAAARALAEVQRAERAAGARSAEVAAQPGEPSRLGAGEAAGAAPLWTGFSSASSEPAAVPAALHSHRVPPTTVVVAFAAVILTGALGVAMVGSRYLVTSPTSTASEASGGRSAASLDAKALLQAAPPAGDNAAAASGSSPAASTKAPDFITVTSRVYRSEGAASVDPATLHDVGTVTASLTDSGTATQHQLRAGSDPDALYLADDSGRLIGLKRVKREYNSQTYYLTAADIATFATWPTLPATIAPPTASNGYPTFVPVGSDSNGVQVYRLASSPASGGIGIAPGTPDSDPAAGNPNWTYWDVTP